MLKKLFAIILLCALMITVTLMNQFFMDLQTITTFKSYVSPQFKLSQSQICDYFGEDEQLRNKASNAIVSSTLKNLGYDHWIEYLNYIDLMVYEGDIIPGKGLELIVVLNLSKDTAVIAVYTHINDEYIYTNSIKDIVPVKNLTFIKVPEHNYSFLVTEQILDERFGAYYIDQFIEIFFYTENKFKSVWRYSKFSQEVYNLRWTDSTADGNTWVKITENNGIEFTENMNLSINTTVIRQKFMAEKDSFPSDLDFHLVEEVLTGESFYWSPKYLLFVLKEGVEKDSMMPIAIIKDTSQLRESFMGIKSNSYKVKTDNGDILYLGKEMVIMDN